MFNQVYTFKNLTTLVALLVFAIPVYDRVRSVTIERTVSRKSKLEIEFLVGVFLHIPAVTEIRNNSHAKNFNNNFSKIDPC